MCVCVGVYVCACACACACERERFFADLARNDCEMVVLIVRVLNNVAVLVHDWASTIMPVLRALCVVA